MGALLGNHRQDLVGKELQPAGGGGNRKVTDPHEVLNDYGDDEWEAVLLPVLRAATVTEIARRAGMDRAGLSDYLRARSPRTPPPWTGSATLSPRFSRTRRCGAAKHLAVRRGHVRARRSRARSGTDERGETSSLSGIEGDSFGLVSSLFD